jgi:hypothetical protein
MIELLSSNLIIISSSVLAATYFDTDIPGEGWVFLLKLINFNF